MQRLFAGLRIAYRAPLVLALLLAGLAIVILVFPRLGWPKRDRTVRAWSRLLLRACGVRLVERPAPGACSLADLHGGAMLLANHVNWLDVFLVLSVAPSHFVAKMEIARWPVIGALVAGVGTLFVERGRRRAVHELNERIGNMLRAARRVVVFPEGTTSDGKRLLQFHGNLVEPALRENAPIIPVGLRYTGLQGEPTDALRFIGDTTLGQSFRRVLGAPGILAEVHPLPQVQARSRHDVVTKARLGLADRLGLPLDDELAETLRRLRDRDGERVGA
jgi:1-acyl-sn-glycerol-3-phosphate acyltransferase